MPNLQVHLGGEGDNKYRGVHMGRSRFSDQRKQIEDAGKEEKINISNPLERQSEVRTARKASSVSVTFNANPNRIRCPRGCLH